MAEPLSPTLERLRSGLAHRAARDRYVGGALVGVAAVCLVVLLAVNVEFSTDYEEETNTFWRWLFAPGGILLVALVVLGVRKEDRKAQWEQAKIDERIEQAAVAAESSTPFASGLKLNRSLLHRYHDLSTQQAHASFRLAHYVMIATAVLLVGGIAAAVAVPTTTASVTIAGVAALASALSGYISSTLIKSYQVAVQQAQVYFREPRAMLKTCGSASGWHAKGVPSPE
ncbi:hypothetical protein [Streptomyces neyagawaensis]|uniref:Integral membrane protein n=1 Tax=Streptomyces neyagawaensis TaxID=42238 RepID=A0ABV3B158_9ACTN